MVYQFLRRLSNPNVSVTPTQLPESQQQTVSKPVSANEGQNSVKSPIIQSLPMNKSLFNVQQEDLKKRNQKFLSSSDNLIVGL
ncbi:hypothetical protein PSN45_001981 [Yamadazyma tenuis]|uniref:Uncharacterized protein n=1 Tax=Candida tenuis (strain ATCC 10573 / BCRC 21748 / CBS 615 / JCM 9827 / NBRC 10315 / NRRL Y-1498 / VKM Y-70) TaxID=590646 RepID=G3BD82_CANTC|nr:uncharacterized protein CANTEDRAFT_116322 [Yamadazyma tenuis ATCC 10573]EGV60264.1 hypothetical protein CANTEDRAFT_116322 [Yamadazyma tenuis ATCC 10573]WEJ94495.1 hypothetical protein PSN45_001981 [Yamadazyma tenuis]